MIYQYKYTILSIILLIAILGMTTFEMYFSFRREPLPVGNTELPDTIIENVTAIILNKQGKPKLKIVTPKMVHFTENDMSKLISPELTLYRKSPQPWFITAKYAHTSKGIENVYFWDNVTIHHAADWSHPATLIKTIALLVHPNKQTAQTNDLVTMIQPNLNIKATGMYADMNTGDIKLKSQIRGEYVPNS